jgi:hypothetical protein
VALLCLFGCLPACGKIADECILESDSNVRDGDAYLVNVVNQSSGDIYLLIGSGHSDVQLLSPQGDLHPADPCGRECTPPYDLDWCGSTTAALNPVLRLAPGETFARRWTGLDATDRTLPKECGESDEEEAISCTQRKYASADWLVGVTLYAGCEDSSACDPAVDLGEALGFVGKPGPEVREGQVIEYWGPESLR